MSGEMVAWCCCWWQHGGCEGGAAAAVTVDGGDVIDRVRGAGRCGGVRLLRGMMVVVMVGGACYDDDDAMVVVGGGGCGSRRRGGRRVEARVRVDRVDRNNGESFGLRRKSFPAAARGGRRRGSSPEKMSGRERYV
ncbi:hypothetical protein Tco_0850341 [Tanacetum coccineum]